MKIFSILFLCFSLISCVGGDSGFSKSSISTPNISFDNWFQSNNGITDVAPNLLAKNFYVVLDGSGSMDSTACGASETKEIVAKRYLEIFANSLPQDYNLGLLAFDGKGITERVPLSTDNRNYFVSEVNRTDTNSGTPLKTAISNAYKNLSIQAKKQSGYGEYHLVIVTDGEAGIGEDPSDIVDRIATKTPVIVHTLGFCLGEGHSLNKPGFVDYKPANNPKELIDGLKQILAESTSFSSN